VTEDYRKRLVKYQDKLFTFLNHDGVPWNNNNAEHAVKHFAYYREVADYQISESGLNPYLILLSLYVTCKYKKLIFSNFSSHRRRTSINFVRTLTRENVAKDRVVPKGFIFSRRVRRKQKHTQNHLDNGVNGIPAEKVISHAEKD